MKQIINKIGSAISTLALLLTPTYIFAAPLEGLGDAASSISQGPGGTAVTPLPELVGGFINAFLGVLGIVFVLLVIYAGILYMTAAGDDSKVKKAKTLLIQAVIGIIIIISAYAISSFIIGQLLAATT